MGRNKKHSYLVLEVLVGIALLAIFLGSGLVSPIKQIKKSREEVQVVRMHLEGKRYLDLMEEKLRTGEISWESVRLSEKKKVEIALNEPRMGAFLSKGNFQAEPAMGTVEVTVNFLAAKGKKPIHTVQAVFFVAPAEKSWIADDKK